MTTIIELLGLALLVAAAYLGLGLAPALALAGLACLAISFNIERSRPAGRSEKT